MPDSQPDQQPRGQRAIQFGIYLPQVALGFGQLLDRALECERLGYDALWLYDHLYAPGVPGQPSLEAWTLATALLARTERLRVGHLVLCNSFRHPALLGKMATTLDVISGGRLELGIGSGSVPDEHDQAGLPWGSPRERGERLREALEIITRMFDPGSTGSPTATYEGSYYSVRDLPNLPAPAQRPRPPIHIGGDGEKVVLPLVARQADWWNYWLSGTSAEGFRYKMGVLQRCCAEIGRDFQMLRKSVIGPVMMAETQHELNLLIAEAEKTDAHFRLGTGLGLIGTPDTIIQRIEEYRQLGVSLFIVTPFPFTRTSFLELFAEKVIAQVR